MKERTGKMGETVIRERKQEGRSGWEAQDTGRRRKEK
jgi:hypothetical protein